MNNFIENDLDQYSDVLADGLRDVAADLRTIDLVDMVSYIRFGSYATLEDLVHSSTELFFKQGTLSFAWNAAIDLGWGEPPIITMAMEFRHHAVSVFFDLTLRAVDESVKVCAILFEDPVEEGSRGVARLGAAVAGARLPGRPSPRPNAALQLRRQGDA